MKSQRAIIFLICASYCIFSTLMTFVNKVLLSQLHFTFPFVLFLWQNSFSFALLGLVSHLKLFSVASINANTAIKWLPVNLLFVLYVITSTFSLQRLSVPMVTIFKNLQTILVAVGDRAFFQQTISLETFISILLMLVGSIVAGLNDLEWDTIGYIWMLVNVSIGAAYVLYMRRAIVDTGLGQLDGTYYNNALSIPLLVPCIYMFNEIPNLITSESWKLDNYFVIAFMLSGFCAFALSLTSVWVVHSTSPTTYSMVGALNKIPQTILAILFFKTPLSGVGAASMVIGLFGGVLYSYTKNKEYELKHTIIEDHKE